LPNSTHQSEDCFTLKSLNPTQTEVSLYLIAWPSGVFKYLLPIVRPLFAKRVEQDLEDFKAYVEAV